MPDHYDAARTSTVMEARPRSAHPRRIGVIEAPDMKTSDNQRKSSTGARTTTRRRSLTFEEWSLAVVERDKQNRRQIFDVKTKERGFRKNSLSFEEWNQLVEEKQKQEQKKKAEKDKVEKEKRAVLEEQKFRRKISFEQWMDQKSQKEARNGVNHGRRSSVACGVAEKEFAKRDEEEIEKAFQKWLLKKEEEELSNEEHKLWLILNPPKKTPTKKTSVNAPPSALVRNVNKDTSNPKLRRSSAPNQRMQGKEVVTQ